MSKLTDKVIYRYHTIIMTENDVLRAIKALNMFGIYDMNVGNCGWAEEDKWFIQFTTSNGKWKDIVEAMRIVRVWTYCDIPQETRGRVYSND